MIHPQPLTGRRIGLLSAWASRLGGGVFEAVVAQARLLEAAGAHVQVFALRDQYSGADAARFAGIQVQTFAVRGPEQIGYAPALLGALEQARLDCLHLHGIWMYPSLAASRWARRSGSGYIVSPHGMLDPWITARGRWKKALARAAYEQRSWQRASFLHALTAREAADIARESGRHDSAVIANPGPPLGAVPLAPRAAKLVYIGRIHPKKNLITLIEGWHRATRPAGSTLTIAGWGERADLARLDSAVRAAGPSVQFIGPVYGAAKQALLDGARFTVLASHSEGLPMAVLEGWAAGTPAIMTSQCNLPQGFAAGAALESGYAPEPIATVIAKALALDHAAWLSMALAARELAAGPFAAETIAARWNDAYLRAIAGKGDNRDRTA